MFCRCLGCALAGLRIIRILSRVYRPPFWCMKTAINRWIKTHWRSMTSNWRNITSPVAAIIAGIPGAIISAEQSLKKAAHLFWIICTNRVRRRAKTATSMYMIRGLLTRSGQRGAGENCHIVPDGTLYSCKRLREVAIQRGHLVEILDPLSCYMNINPAASSIHYKGRKLPYLTQ